MKIKLSNKEKILKRNVQKYMDDFVELINDSGIFLKTNIKDYFPRVYDFGKIQRNADEFKKVLVEIFKNDFYISLICPTFLESDYIEKNSGEFVQSHFLILQPR